MPTMPVYVTETIYLYLSSVSDNGKATSLAKKWIEDRYNEEIKNATR
jgi:hypothetical protein